MCLLSRVAFQLKMSQKVNPATSSLSELEAPLIDKAWQVPILPANQTRLNPKQTLRIIATTCCMHCLSIQHNVQVISCRHTNL